MSNYVYIPTEGNNLFTVGFYDPSGKFISDSDHSDREAAAKRVRFLNGGDSEITRLSEIIENTNTLLRSNQGEITMLRGHLQEAKRVNEQLQGWKEEMLQLERTCNFNDLAKLLGAPAGVECRAWVKTNLPDIIEGYKTELLEVKRFREAYRKALHAIRKRLTELGIPDSENSDTKGDRLFGEPERLNLFIERVRQACEIIREAPELNMGNYNEDEVRDLNNAAIEAHGILAALLLNCPAPEPEGRTFNYVCVSCMKPFTSPKPLGTLICDDCVPF